ncbi:MAG: ribonuclease Y [Spirochaetales bacterium]|nr:ribonuclease Y [Spirochaetales bacterium]
MVFIIGIICTLTGMFLGWIIRWLYARFQLTSSEQKAKRIIQEAQKEAETRKREVLLETKDQLIKEKNQLEKETRERRNELSRMERRLIHKEENLERKVAQVEKQERAIANRERVLSEKETEIDKKQEKWKRELERISGISAEEAKKLLIQSLENEARHDAQVLLNRIEQEAQLTAEKKAREIIITTIQRIATDITSEVAVTSVSLPNDEMKGRIIGREGRNIRTLETLSGVDIIIDDTPEAVVISCFDPIRKEIAKISLERLISDGRIHPARIEEVVQKVTKEISQKIYEEGEKVLFELGIHNFRPEGIRVLGRLHFRSSYGQNVLKHSKEVAILAGLIASELGANVEIAKRAALLHDIGKGVETESEGNHAEIGMEQARKLGEDPKVINAIGAHHNDVEPSSLEAIIVQIADAISASRPGARRETLDNYLKRLENLEKIADDFEGVEKSYAIQAGRELRIIVNNESVSDNEAKELAKKIAKRIEDELKYPGRIKVTIIRETRILEYAR